MNEKSAYKIVPTQYSSTSIFTAVLRLQSKHSLVHLERSTLIYQRGVNGNHDTANNNNKNNTMDHHENLPVFQIKSLFFTVNNVMIEI